VTVSNFSGEDVVLRTSAANVGLAAPLCATVASGATASFAAPLHLLWDVAGAASGKALRTSTLINLPYTFYLSPSASDPEGVVDYECTKNWLLPAAAWGGCFAAAAWLRHGTPEFVADPALCARTFGGDPSFCARLEATTPVTSFMRTPLFYVGVVGAAVLAALWAVLSGPLAPVTCGACHGRRWAWTGGLACRLFGWCDCVSPVLKDRCAYWAAKTGQPYAWSAANADDQGGQPACSCCLATDPTSCVSCVHLSGAICQPCAAGAST